jgi:hypothetical protein
MDVVWLTSSSNFDLSQTDSDSDHHVRVGATEPAATLFLEVMFFKVRPEWQVTRHGARAGKPSGRASDDLFMRRHRIPDTLMGMRLALVVPSWPIGWMD